MSAWLFMSLPGAACLFGYRAAWIAIGLFIGTYLNWRIVAHRLRNFTASFGDSITVPEYLQNRFHTQFPYIRLICSTVILIFFLLYVASGFSAEAKLFEELFSMNYRSSLFLCAFIILFYTFLGGFQAVCWTDFFQSILMFFALLIVPIIVLGRLPASESGELVSGEYVLGTLFSSQTDNGIGDIISGLGWGLGYFGMPHILVRFMAIRSADEIKRSRVIAVSWVFLTLAAAIAIGVFGGAYLASQGVVYETQAMAERIFMRLSTMLFSSWIAGILLSAILAAIMSTVSSQLLVVGSAMVNDIYCMFSKNQTNKRSMLLSRISIVLVTGLGIGLAWFPDSSVMGFVSYAWAGFGATFAPIILLSLILKRLTLKGAMAGMVLRAVGVIAWESLDMYSVTGFTSIVPCFIFSILSIVVVSLLDKEPDKKLMDQFEKASNM
ncbi:MAG: sodium/proline symporter [Bacteroides sp.]|nr:sodium/proline symporter [Bacteroides sp.]